MRSDQNIESHIEFFMTNEQRIVNVPLYDVWLRLIRGIGPLTDISDGSKEENAFALTSSNLNKESVTGFIIQTPFCSLYLLNSYAKMGY